VLSLLTISRRLDNSRGHCWTRLGQSSNWIQQQRSCYRTCWRTRTMMGNWTDCHLMNWQQWEQNIWFHTIILESLRM
jgi:hypothetical protein